MLDIIGSSDEKLRGTRHARVAELYNSLVNVASAIIASRGGAPDQKDILSLKPLSQNTQACLSGAITDVAQVKGIAARVGAVIFPIISSLQK